MLIKSNTRFNNSVVPPLALVLSYALCSRHLTFRHTAQAHPDHSRIGLSAHDVFSAVSAVVKWSDSPVKGGPSLLKKQTVCELYKTGALQREVTRIFSCSGPVLENRGCLIQTLACKKWHRLLYISWTNTSRQWFIQHIKTKCANWGN